MIRIRIELLPGGVEDLGFEVDSFIVACKWPITPEAQNLHVLHGRDYALVENFNANKGGWLGLLLAALRALHYRAVRLQGGEVFPGTLALDPAEFDAHMAALVGAAGKYLHSIRLFGRRAREDVTPATFAAKLAALLKDKARQTTIGGLIFTEYPGYVVYDLAVRLFRKHYQTGPHTAGGVTFPNYGEFLEAALQTAFCLRPFPWAPAMQCANGLRLLFVRPSGEIATGLTRDQWQSGSTLVYSEQSDPKLYRDLHADIRAGRVLYDVRGGLRQYPGAAPFGGADVLPSARAGAPLLEATQEG